MAADLKEHIKAVIEKHGKNMPSDYKKMAEEAILKMSEENISPKEAFQIDDKLMDIIYQNGYQLFQAGKLREALAFFIFLRSLDAVSYNYWFAVAACYQRMQEYSFAVANYMIASKLDPFNPLPYFHIYDCFIKQDNPYSALRALYTTIQIAEKDPKYNDLKEKASLELEKVKKEVFDRTNKKFKK